MPSSRFEIFTSDWNFGYTDNDTENIFKASYYWDSFDGAKRSSLMASLSRNAGTVDLRTLEGGKCLLKLANNNPYGWAPTQIVLHDKKTDWYFFYFCESTGRIINRDDGDNYYEEFNITLNYYASYLEPFIVRSINEYNKSGGFNLFKNLQVKSSNHIPKYWGVDKVTGSPLSEGYYLPDKFGWYQDSLTTLPEYLKLSENSNFRIGLVNNIFDANWNYRVGYDGDGWSHYQIKGQWDSKNNTFSSVWFVDSVGRVFGEMQVVFKDKTNLIFTGDYQSELNTFRNSCDTDTWALYHVSSKWKKHYGLSTVDYIEGWEGYGNNTDPQGILVMVPVGGNSGRYYELPTLLERFGDRKDAGMGLIGVFKNKANFFLHNYCPKALAMFDAEDLGMGTGGNQKNHFVFGFVVGGLPQSLMPTVPDKQMGWYFKKTLSLYEMFPTPKAGVRLKTNITTIDELLLHSYHARGANVVTINVDDKWINYDHTYYNNGWHLNVFYTMVGYEMTWVVPLEDYNTGREAKPLEPYKSNRFSLGLSNVKVNQLGKYNSSAQSTINANSRQWENSQNLADYNFETEEALQPWREAKAIGSSASISGIINGLLSSGSNWAQSHIEEQENRMNYAKIRAEKNRIPAMKQDLQNNITTSFPSGNILWTTNQYVNAYCYGWNVNFRVQVFNYLNSHGWKNFMYDWTPIYLTQNYSSLIFAINQMNQDNNFNFQVRQLYSVANVSFMPDEYTIMQNIYDGCLLTVNGKKVTMPMPNNVKNWIIKIMYDGIKLNLGYRNLRNAKTVETISEITINPDRSKFLFDPTDQTEDISYGCEQNAQATTQTKTKRGTNCEPCKTNRERTRTRVKKTDSVDNRVRSRVSKSEG